MLPYTPSSAFSFASLAFGLWSLRSTTRPSLSMMNFESNSARRAASAGAASLARPGLQGEGAGKNLGTKVPLDVPAARSGLEERPHRVRLRTVDVNLRGGGGGSSLTSMNSAEAPRAATAPKRKDRRATVAPCPSS